MTDDKSAEIHWKELRPQIIKIALELGPLLVFFFGNANYDIFTATAWFMGAMVVSLLLSWIFLKKVAIMPLVTGLVVLIFGSLTLILKDDTFIKMKPTIVYAMFAVILGYGLATGKPLLKALLETAYPGLNDTGWRKLTINWVGFFAFMAVLNEAVWRTQTWDFWVGFKLWGAVPLTLLFAIANIPMLMKHGLNDGKATPLPPEG